MKIDNPHFELPHSLIKHTPLVWHGKRDIIERIKTLDAELREKGYECLIGGDMDFTLTSAKDIQENASRRDFVNQVLDHLEAKFTALKEQYAVDPKDQEKLRKTEFILDRLEAKRHAKNFGGLFRFCFMAELNRQAHDELSIAEPNFPWCGQPENPLSEKDIKPFFDFGAPEIQLKPASAEDFLRNTYQIYWLAARLADKYLLDMELQSEHIHLSVHKDGENLTARTESDSLNEQYHPHYKTLLAGVKHMTNKCAHILGISKYPLLVSESKIADGDIPSIRACKDNMEYRCSLEKQPMLAKNLLVLLSGIALGVDEIEGKKTFEKYGVKKEDASREVPYFMFSNQHPLVLKNRGFTRTLNTMLNTSQLDEDKRIRLHPYIKSQLLVGDKKTRFWEGKEIVAALEGLSLERNATTGQMQLRFHPDEVKLEMPLEHYHTLNEAIANLTGNHPFIRFHNMNTVIDFNEEYADIANETGQIKPEYHLTLPDQPVIRDYIGESIAKTFARMYSPRNSGIPTTAI